MQANTSNPPLKGLFGSLASEVATLFRTEIRLAQTEASEKVGKMAAASVMLVIGAILALAALLVLLDAAVAYLRDVVLVTPWIAALAVGLAVAVLALIFIAVGRGRLRASSLTPERTIGSLSRDAASVSERAR